MPRYDFKCEGCGHKFTVSVSIEERKKVSCPGCGSKEVKQIISGCAINIGGCGEPSAGGG